MIGFSSEMFCSCRISTDKCLARSLCHSRATCTYLIQCCISLVRVGTLLVVSEYFLLLSQNLSPCIDSHKFHAQLAVVSSWLCVRECYPSLQGSQGRGPASIVVSLVCQLSSVGFLYM